ncbi:hypothetical protein FACS189488_02420 [Betaproteobacteria bacterium]|nr:hypothetical protein FACS189488_02420 [Betaproteobacteria bacterium]
MSLLGRDNVHMPTAGLQTPPAPETQIQSLVRQGQSVYQHIMANDMPNDMPPVNSANVNALMWFLQAQGSAKAAVSAGVEGSALFQEGAFQIEDPHHRLENWLNSSPDSYSRSSSHLAGFQAEGEAYRPRGLDARGEATPNERRTILFQRLPDRADGGRTVSGAPRLDRPMLFLKMEPHGCRGLGLHSGRPGETASGFFGRIKNFFSNLGDWLGHAGGFAGTVLRAIGLQSTGQNNRERLPSDLTRDYKALTKQAADVSEALGPGYRYLKDLNNGQPLSDSGGLRVMRENIRTALSEDDAKTSVTNGALAMPPDLRHSLEEFLARIDRFDNPDMRIGCEVILTEDDFVPANPVGWEG